MEWLEGCDERLTWHNAEELRPVGGGLLVQRVAESWRTRFPEPAAGRAVECANTFVRFRTDAGRIAIRWRNRDQLPERRSQAGEVFCDGRLVGEFPIVERQEAAFESDGGGLWEVHFPWRATVLLEGIGVESGRGVMPEKPEERRRWLAYGDSITQGVAAGRATGTWVWMASQSLGLEPINMGFGGAAFGEEVVAEYIARRRDWDILSLAWGVNNIWHGWKVADVAAAYERFLGIIRDVRPNEPILCITPVLTRREDMPMPGGERVQEFRDAIADVVKRRMRDDGNLHLLDGLTCLHDTDDLDDDVHPNDTGMRHYADRVIEAWSEILAGDIKHGESG